MDRGDEGCRAGAVVGTSWHGVFESDEFRAAFLTWVADARGIDWIPGGVRFDDVRNGAFDTIADAIDEHLDTDALLRVIERGAVPLPSARS